MRPLLAIADLRFRGAVAARLAWLVPAAFAGGAVCASWAPGTDDRARAAAGDAAALGAAAAVALLAVLVLAATAFAGEVRTTAAHTILSAPVGRGTVVAGGVAGHAAAGALLVLAMGAAAALGLDAGGLGARARGPVRPFSAAAFAPGPGGEPAALGATSRELRATFPMPRGLAEGEPLHLRLSPRGQVETDWSPAGVLAVSAGPPGAPGPEVRVPFKAGVAFAADVAVEGVAAGEPCEVVLRFVEGGWRLRFSEGSVEVGGARERFAWNLVKAALCAIPLLAMAAAAGAAASARMGAAASTALVLALLLVVAGREVIADGAAFVVRTAEREAEEHGHEGHDHHVEITGAQVALARTALVALRAVPDADDFWRFGDVAAGRAVTPRDAGRSALAGLLPCAALLGASWLLLRRRELLPE